MAEVANLAYSRRALALTCPRGIAPEVIRGVAGYIRAVDGDRAAAVPYGAEPDRVLAANMPAAASARVSWA